MTKLQNSKRLIIVALFIFLLFSILVFQFYNIQINEGDKWSGIAKKQHFFAIKEPFLRGAIYDTPSNINGNLRQAQPIVYDIQKFHLYADPLSIPKEYKEEVAETILEKLNLNQKESLALKGSLAKNSRSRRLAMWLDSSERNTIESWWQTYARQHKIPRNALYFVSDYQRAYPFGKMLGQVLHTVQQNKDPLTEQALPTGGLELYFNELLQGKQGKRVLMRSPRRSFETGMVIAEPENGADIYLTIDRNIQAIMEEELEKGVKKTRSKGGWAVMMEPRTGEILGLAQYPFFEPENYQAYFNDPSQIEHSKVKAICDANEPASVMKGFSLSIALKANEELMKRGEKPIFFPQELINTADGNFPGRRKKLPDIHPCKKLNMWMGIQKSSNIYFARLTERIIDRLGNEWYRKALQETFGFGLKTHIELPSESEGLLPRLGKKHPNGALEWSKATPYSLCIGHNIQMTSVQLARAFAVFANGGYLVEPTLIRKIVKKKSQGETEILVDNTSPERISRFPQTLCPKIVSQVVDAMKFVTKPGGTAWRADIWGYTEVGKTGTAEKVINGTYSKKLHVTDFAGFAPVNKAAFVLAVVLDEPEFRYIRGLGENHRGGATAAPIFKDISKRTLEYLGIPPDDPHGYPKGDPRYDPELADWIQETLRLQEIYEKWNK